MFFEVAWQRKGYVFETLNVIYAYKFPSLFVPDKTERSVISEQNSVRQLEYKVHKDRHP